jgi:hypothetical protein
MHVDALARTADAAPLESDAIVAANKHRKRSRRAVFLTWLRKTHLYLGLWGAALGLLFGLTGILMNHRAIMKVPLEKIVQTTAQLPLPAHGFRTPEELSAWLQQELDLPAKQPPNIRSNPARKIVWGDREVMQPERWVISIARPDRGVIAEYFVGNRTVKIDRIDATPIGTLMRLHTATGVSAFWVLLSDTIAGSLILLSLTGLLLWTQLHARRTIAVLTSCGALFAALWFMWTL